MMENKIPTAREFLKTFGDKFAYSDGFGEAMIEFAKLHVQRAIKECIENAPSGSSTDTVSYEDVVEALKDCYSLSNIK